MRGCYTIHTLTRDILDARKVAAEINVSVRASQLKRPSTTGLIVVLHVSFHYGVSEKQEATSLEASNCLCRRDLPRNSRTGGAYVHAVHYQ